MNGKSYKWKDGWLEGSRDPIPPALLTFFSILSMKIPQKTLNEKEYVHSLPQTLTHTHTPQPSENMAPPQQM